LLITVPAAMLVSGLLAPPSGRLSLRTGGVQFIMITLAFAQMIFFFFVSLKAYGGEDGIIIRRTNEFLGLNMRDRTTLYYVILGFCGGVLCRAVAGGPFVLRRGAGGHEARTNAAWRRWALRPIATSCTPLCCRAWGRGWRGR
jgi:hypothetical protein